MKKCESRVVRLSRFGINVRLHRIAARETVVHQVCVWLRICPNAALSIRILRGVRAQNRTENSPLNPAQIEFRIDGAGHVPADVVAPVCIAHVGSRGREVWLECERLPDGDGVPGKTDLVAMVAQSSPAMKQ